LAGLPGKIEELEHEIARLTAVLSQPGFYQGDFTAVQETNRQLAEAQRALETAYRRWSELE
jgi:ATP-binding cassette subfamily F protein uup